MNDERAGLTPADAASSDDHVADSEPMKPGLHRRVGTIVPIVLAVCVLLVAILALGGWTSIRSKTTVPWVTGLSVPAATSQLEASKLTTATMATVATSEYDDGIVIRQLPEGTDRVAIGTPVDLLVAVAPTTTVVPDVSLETTPAAMSILGGALLRPVIHEQLSDSVDYGRVVAQMPRAGARIVTGEQVVLLISIGRGSGGAVVPNVLGQSVEKASTMMAEVYLLAFLYDLQPGMSANDKVTDQIPAPGSVAPVGAPVTLMTSGMSN